MLARKNTYYIVSVSRGVDHVYYKTPCGDGIHVATVEKMGANTLNNMTVTFTGVHTSLSMVARVGALYAKLYPMHQSGYE